MLKFHAYAGCPGLAPAISVQFTPEMCTAAEKNNKISYRLRFKVIQGHLRSSMLTPFKTSSLVLVMISSMSVSICNCFHAKRANTSETLFKGLPLVDARLRRPP